MARVQTYTVDAPWLDVQCKLGEGLCYNHSKKELRFLDIVGKKLHLIDMTVGKSSLRILDLPTVVGSTAEVHDSPDELLCGGYLGVGFLNTTTGQYDFAAPFHDDATVAQRDPKLQPRTNDGSVDPLGRFVVGTLVDPAVTEGFPAGGQLYRVDNDLSVHHLLEDERIPNGSSWSADGRTFYYTDSMTGGIDMLDYDLETGNISNRRVFWKAGPDDGVPDGHCRDAEGHYWVAMAYGSQVIRLSPDGQVVARVHLPTRLITDTALVDGYLYIVSGTDSEPEAHPESAKNQGMVYRCHVGVQGVPDYQFRRTR